MYSKVWSAAVFGMDVSLVQVEADVSNGLPTFQMVGYLSSEVKEAGERVRTAIKNVGFQIPAKRIVVNLSPADVRKQGVSFDLPIALSLLAALGYLKSERFLGTVIVGELGLAGQVRKVTGVLPVVLAAKEADCKRCIVPVENREEAELVGGMEVIGVSDLLEAADYLRTGEKPKEKKQNSKIPKRRSRKLPDFSEVKGQEVMKRAAEIAVAGGHNLLFIGPPGAGKTMVARRIPSILPKLTEEEKIEILKVYSVLGRMEETDVLLGARPFREVHHTVTRAALVGGGSRPMPGEVSLANKGVLFLDELPEFSRGAMESLRQPLEERLVHIGRRSGSYAFPADVILCGAANPCPCGHYPNRQKCNCTEHQVAVYRNRISGPLLDRIDLCVEVEKVGFAHLREKEKGESSVEIRKRVEQARKIQRTRYAKIGKEVNAALSSVELENYCRLGCEEEAFLKKAYETFDFTARVCHKIIKVARTIADLAGSESIEIVHLSEAIGYRAMEQKNGR